MGATDQSITKVYYNNSTTATTVSKKVPSEIIQQVTDISGTVTPAEVARDDEVHPGVKGGMKHEN
jgi:hypothetical protein